MAHEHAVKETIFENDAAHEVPSTSSTLTTFGILAGLTVVAIGVGFSDLGPIKVVFSLLIATVQAGVLAVYFMDLRPADRLTWLCAGAALFWVGIIVVLTAPYYMDHVLHWQTDQHRFSGVSAMSLPNWPYEALRLYVEEACGEARARPKYRKSVGLRQQRQAELSGNKVGRADRQREPNGANP